MSDTKRLVLLTTTFLEIIAEQNGTIESQEELIKAHYVRLDDQRVAIRDLEDQAHRDRHSRYDVNQVLQKNEEMQSELYSAQNALCAYKLDLAMVFRMFVYMETIEDVHGNKIECIKCVREKSMWGLKDAKNFVDAYFNGTYASHLKFYHEVIKVKIAELCKSTVKDSLGDCTDPSCESCNP